MTHKIPLRSSASSARQEWTRLLLSESSCKQCGKGDAKAGIRFCLCQSAIVAVWWHRSVFPRKCRWLTMKCETAASTQFPAQIGSNQQNVHDDDVRRDFKEIKIHSRSSTLLSNNQYDVVYLKAAC